MCQQTREGWLRCHTCWWRTQWSGSADRSHCWWRSRRSLWSYKTPACWSCPWMWQRSIECCWWAASWRWWHCCYTPGIFYARREHRELLEGGGQRTEKIVGNNHKSVTGGTLWSYEDEKVIMLKYALRSRKARNDIWYIPWTYMISHMDIS